jgi:predicted TIM-barrel fold metal-dependent hydrolase
MIDAHCHLDSRLGSAVEALRHVALEAEACGVSDVVIINIAERGFPHQDVMNAISGTNSHYLVVPAINPLAKQQADWILSNAGKVHGVKLHPRIHGFSLENRAVHNFLKEWSSAHKPVIVDCFPDGAALLDGNLPVRIASLAQQFADIRFVMAHAGGHHVLDAMMLVKHVPNLAIDLSFSLLYYRGTPVHDLIGYALRNLKGKRSFWGTDYPDRPYSETVRGSREAVEAFGLGKEVERRFYSDSFKEFWGMQ